MIWDCFTFFNEYELLEIRLNELDAVVDKFVICEATTTFAGNTKPLYYAEAADRPEFKRFKSRVVHIVVRDMPTEGSRWLADFHQRDQIARAWSSCADDDVILVSDADEIPRPSVIMQGVQQLGSGFFRFVMSGYYYYLNGHRAPWDGTMMAHAREWRKVRSGDYLRWKNKNPVDQAAKRKDFPVLRNAGWHFSYLGGVDRVAEKIHSWAHAEHDKPTITDHETIRKHIEAGEDLYGRPACITYVPMDDSFPAYVLANRKKFQHLIKEP